MSEEFTVQSRYSSVAKMCFELIVSTEREGYHTLQEHQRNRTNAIYQKILR